MSILLDTTNMFLKNSSSAFRQGKEIEKSSILMWKKYLQLWLTKASKLWIWRRKFQEIHKKAKINFQCSVCTHTLTHTMFTHSYTCVCTFTPTDTFSSDFAINFSFEDSCVFFVRLENTHFLELMECNTKIQMKSTLSFTTTFRIQRKQAPQTTSHKLFLDKLY